MCKRISRWFPSGGFFPQVNLERGAHDPGPKRFPNGVSPRSLLHMRGNLPCTFHSGHMNQRWSLRVPRDARFLPEKFLLVDLRRVKNIIRIDCSLDFSHDFYSVTAFLGQIFFTGEPDAMFPTHRSPQGESSVVDLIL